MELGNGHGLSRSMMCRANASKNFCHVNVPSMFGRGVTREEDGPSLFVSIVSHTSAMSLSTAMSAKTALARLDPGKFKYDIVQINTEIIHLFDQASIVTPMTDDEKRLAIIVIYLKIKTPQEWFSWVQTKSESIDEYPVYLVVEEYHSLVISVSWVPFC